MNRFRLNRQTKENIYLSTGMDVDSISVSDFSEIDEKIEKRRMITLSPDIEVGGILPRGSVYLMFKRFFTKAYIDRKLSSIKP